jgi:general secretion pathway protein K
MASTRTTRYQVAEAGVALIAVMWGVAILLLVALVFSNSVQIETRSAIYRKEAAQASAMARGGIEAAILELAYTPVSEQQKTPVWTWNNGQREGTVFYPGGHAKLRIVNESGKLDLNVAGREQLGRLFEARGVEPTAAADLAEAIIHWRSGAVADDSAAESLKDYYARAGYPAAHSPFTALEQVLRVRGMTRDLFYGTVDVTAQGAIRSKFGVGRDLTVYSGSVEVNVNYASEPVLLSIPEVTPELARAILQERSNGPFKSVSEMSDRLAEPIPDASLPFLTTVEAKTYSIISEGWVEGSRVRRTVRAVIQLQPRGESQHQIVAWYDDDANG